MASPSVRLGAALRESGGFGPDPGPLVDLAEGRPVDRAAVEAAVGLELTWRLIGEGTFDEGSVDHEGATVRLPWALGLLSDVVFVAPDRPGGSAGEAGRIYLGPDSAFLVEAALRLAPGGERAVELGSGTGVLAAMLARRYRTVVATDIEPRASAAARFTLALNARPPGHVATAIVADVDGGLRPGSFDLVAANTPWVPDAPIHDRPHRVFADGGPTGVELPTRFIRAASGLLRTGGVAVLLALDVRLDDGSRPIRRLCSELDDEGFTSAIVPTPLNWMVPRLVATMRGLQPRLVEAEHVAVVVAAPAPGGGRRHAMLAATESLARRWAQPVTDPACTATPSDLTGSGD